MKDDKRAFVSNNMVMRVIKPPGKPGGQSIPKEGEVVADVNWQDRYMQRMEQDVKDLKQEYRASAQDIKATVTQAVGELRHLDQQRHSDIQQIRASLDDTKKWMIGMAVSVIVGVAAIAVTVFLTR